MTPMWERLQLHHRDKTGVNKGWNPELLASLTLCISCRGRVVDLSMVTKVLRVKETFECAANKRV